MGDKTKVHSSHVRLVDVPTLKFRFLVFRPKVTNLDARIPATSAVDHLVQNTTVAALYLHWRVSSS